MATVKGNVHGSAVAERPAKDRHAETVAKATEPRGGVKLVPGTETILQWFQLHGFSDRNIRADSFGDPIADLYEQVRPLGTIGPKGQQRQETDEDRKRVGDSLVGLLMPGWDQDEKHSIVVTAATSQEQKLAMEERERQLIEWQGRGKEDATFVALASFVKPYWQNPPDAIVHMCHRRTFTLPAVVFARSVRGIGEMGVYPVPVSVRPQLAKLAEIDERLKENLGHELGRSELTPLDYLRIAKMISDADGTEAMLRRYGKVGEAQTAFRYYKLSTHYPEVKLYERAMLPRPALAKGEKAYPYVKGESFIPYSTSMKEALAALLADKRFDDSGPMDKRETRATTVAEVERFAEYYTRGGRPRTTWNEKDTESLLRADRYSTVWQFVGWAIGKNKKAAIDAFDAKFGKAIDKALKDADFSLDDFKQKFA